MAAVKSGKHSYRPDIDAYEIGERFVTGRELWEAAREILRETAEGHMAGKGWTYCEPEPETLDKAVERMESDDGRRDYIVCMLGALGGFGDVVPIKEPLTAWEMDFVASVADQFDRHNRLSDKQMEVLERIYAEKAE